MKLRKEKCKKPSIARNSKQRMKFRIQYVKFNGIRLKLAMGFLIPILLMITLAIYMYHTSSKTVINNYEKATMGTMKKMADFYDQMFEGVRTKAIEYLGDNAISKYYNGQLSKDKTNEMLTYTDVMNRVSRYVTTEKYVNDIFIFGTYGQDIATKKGSKDIYINYMDSEEGKAWGERTEQYYWSGYHSALDELYKLDQNIYGIALTYRMKFDKGFIAMDIKKEMIQKPLEEMNLQKGSLAAFISPDSREITSDVNEVDYFTKLNLYKEIMNTKQESATEYQSVGGIDYLFLFHRVPTVDGYLCLRIPRAQILKEMSPIKTATVGFVIVTSILSVAIGMFIALDLSLVVKKISHAMKKIVDGDLHIDLRTKRKDELGDLENNITAMIDTIRTMVEQTVDVSEHIYTTSQLLGEDSKEVLESSKNIMFAISNVESGNQVQAVGTQECLLLMSDLAKKIEDVYEENGKIGNVVRGTNEVTKQGKGIIDDLNVKAENTVHITEEIVDEIQDLRDQTRIIHGIVDMINEIAQQTNLLSLNASIEAARAGENGLGFAVVAAEIRKLAEQSANAVGKIQDIIRKIQGQIGKTVSTVEVARDSIRSQTDSLLNTNSMFKEIENAIGLLDQGMQITTNKIKEIDEIKNKTLFAVEEFSSIAQENAAVATEITSFSQNQLDVAEKLNATAKVLSEDEQNLVNAVSRFKL